MYLFPGRYVGTVILQRILSISGLNRLLQPMVQEVVAASFGAVPECYVTLLCDDIEVALLANFKIHMFMRLSIEQFYSLCTETCDIHYILLIT